MSVEPSRELLVFDNGWPPAVIIRRRSRRISLRLDNTGGLRINAPHHISQLEIKDFVSRNQAWVQRQQEKSIQNFHQLSGLRLGEFIEIEHIAANQLAAKAKGSVLRLYHPASFNKWSELYEEGRTTIRRVVNHQAKQILPDELMRQSGNSHKQPVAVKIRWMRSRWGSCHPNGTINLNSQLLRLPAELRYYVMAHELTHLTHPHHQSRFWAALESVHGPVKGQRAKLRQQSLWY